MVAQNIISIQTTSVRVGGVGLVSRCYWTLWTRTFFKTTLSSFGLELIITVPAGSDTLANTGRLDGEQHLLNQVFSVCSLVYQMALLFML